MFKSVSNLDAARLKENSLRNFFRGIVMLAANYDQLTDIPSVPGDHPQRTLADTKAQL